ncbi:MAG: OmpH family outer membrane protein [bacterium]
MRVSLRAVPIALALLAVLNGRASAQGQKFAYINSSVLLDQAPGRADAEAQFNKETGPLEEQIKRMSDSLQAMIAAFEKRQAGLTPAARDAQTKEIQAKEASYRQRTTELQQKAQQRQSELVQPILDRIKLAIEDVRVEGGYSFIFNADQGSPIVALDKNLNVTDRVMAKLRSAPATAVAPAKPEVAGPKAAPAGATRPPTSPLD